MINQFTDDEHTARPYATVLFYCTLVVANVFMFAVYMETCASYIMDYCIQKQL